MAVIIKTQIKTGGLSFGEEIGCGSGGTLLDVSGCGECDDILATGIYINTSGINDLPSDDNTNDQ